MKILMPYISRSGHNIHSKIMPGGIEKFCKNIFEMFPHDIIPAEITREERKNKKTKQVFLDYVKKHNPDMILISDIDSYFHIPQIEYGIPTIQIIHEPLVGDIRYVAVFKNLHKFVTAGGHIYFVSDNQQTFFNKNIKRITGDTLSDVKGLINPSFSIGNEEVSTDIEYDVITIGRTDILKNPFYVHKKLQNTELTTCVITNKDNFQHSDNQVKYFNDNLIWEEPQHTIRGLSYDDTMVTLSQAGCYISTCANESWGITALEALSRGIPVILITDSSGKHSTQSIPVSEDHYRIVHRSIKPTELVDIVKELLSFSYEKRLEISRLTKEKHSKEEYKTALDKIFEARLNDVSPRQESILESFFQ
jgi:glycosyltransferase involved in cell wall biosynthesis